MTYFLRSLDITGFKSFARHTPLEFAQGITALVGPNGSGKSNVVDAIRWCLGEQSVRDLRAQRADDIIHAGRQRSLGLAEVSLTFEPVPPAGGSGADLCLTRRLYRSGDSEYLVNGRKARLRDLTAALREVHIDAGRNVVVNQGMADAWLSAGPVDRRALIEQAAGLTAFRERRDEARHKLAQTEQNVEILSTVLSELEPRVRMLRRQARAVQDREDAAAQLRNRLMQWYAHRWETVVKRAAVLERQAADLARKRRESTSRLVEAEELAESRVRREREWNERVNAAVRRLYDAERERDRALVSLHGLRERSEASRRALEEAEARRLQLEADALRARQSCETTKGALDRVCHESDGLNRAVRERRETLRTLEAEVATCKREYHAAVARREQAENGVGRWRKQLQRLQSAEEEDDRHAHQAAERQRTYEREMGVARQELGARGRALVEALRDHDTASERARQIQTEHVAAVERAERIGRLLRAAHANLDQVSRKLDRSDRQVAAMADAAPRGLVSALEVESGWESAIATALGSWAFAGTSENDPHRFHEMHDKNFIQWRATLLEGCSVDAVWADAVVRSTPRGFSHPLVATLCVETDADAARLWGELARLRAREISSPPIQVVSRQGCSWSAVGVQPPPRDDRALRLLEARRAVRMMQRKRDVLALRVHRLQQAEREAVERQRLLRDDLASAARAREVGGGQVAQMRERVRVLEQRLLAYAEEQTSEAARIAGIDARRSDRARELADVRRAIDGAQKVAESCLPAIHAQHSRLQDLERRCQELRTALQHDRGRGDALEAERAALARQRDTAERDAERCEAQVQACRRQQQDLQDLLARNTAQTDQLRGRGAELDELTRACERDVETVKSEAPTAPNGPALTDLRSALSDVIGEHERALAQLAQVAEERHALEHEVERDLGVNTAALPKAIGTPPTVEDIRKLRNRATHYGDVDASVVQEHAALADRQQNLEKNIADLRGAMDELRDIMSTAEREMRRRFDQAFAAVSEEFARVFKVILHGGEARLELVPDSGGIEIYAQLPGRRARSSAAFSGGERALIASALLFGVLRIRPTPFCILDEVDAALDESNVDRYLRVLRDTSQRTQIILVTHNRATMAVADALYGLTMDGDGVSSTLSLKLDTYDAAG